MVVAFLGLGFFLDVVVTVIRGWGLDCDLGSGCGFCFLDLGYGLFCMYFFYRHTVPYVQLVKILDKIYGLVLIANVSLLEGLKWEYS